MDAQKILLMRDERVRSHLEQYAPVWLVSQQVAPEEDSATFEVVFQTPYYGWVNRRYRFDAFNNVLYYLGETVVPEEQVVQLQEQQHPYLEVDVSDIPASYGG